MDNEIEIIVQEYLEKFYKGKIWEIWAK
jgi:hypothetical protein